MKWFALIFVALHPASVFAQDIEKLLGSLDPLVVPATDARVAPGFFGKMLKAERDTVNRDDVAAWKALAAAKNKAEWERFSAASRESLKKSLGTLPALTTKAIPSHVSGTHEGQGYAVENLVFESRPGLWVTANLYRPVPLPRSAPGILIVHSHHNPKSEGELQDMGVLWAKAGCYVLIPDQLGHGERRQHPFVDKESFPNPFRVGRQDYYFRYNLGMQLHLVGESLIGWMANDMIAGVTLLLSKPSIDPARLIVLGAVAGGGDPAAVTAALDPRIQCLVPFNFGGPQPETKYPLPENADESFDFMGSGGWESTRNLADSAAGSGRKKAMPGEGRFLPWLIVASIAPRYLIHAHEFSWDGARDPVWKRYQKIWSWYDAKEKLGVAHGRGTLSGKPPEATHCNNIGPEHRAMIHPLFDRWFDIVADERGVKNERRPASALQCWTPELKAKLKPKTVQELLVDLWSKRGTGPEEPLRGALAGMARATRFAESSESVVAVDDRAETLNGGLTVRRVVLEGKRFGFRIPMLKLTPKDNDGRTVIAFGPRGRSVLLKERREEIAGLLREGIAVCLPEFVGTGELSTSEARGRNSAATSQSSTVRMLGGSMACLRMNQFDQVMYFLRTDAAKLSLDFRFCVWAESDLPVNEESVRIEVPHDAEPAPKVADPMTWAGVPLAFALSSPELKIPCRGILSRGSLLGYRTALETPFIHVSHEELDVPFLAMEPADFLLSTIKFDRNRGKRLTIVPLRIEAPIDAQNRPASQPDINGAFENLREAADNLRVISASASRSSAKWVVRWFADRMK